MVAMLLYSSLIKLDQAPNGSRMTPSKAHRLDKGEEGCGQKRSLLI
jgi:hypothetical protein